VSERFFNDDATPAAAVLFRQAGISKLLDDQAEELGDVPE